MTSAFDFYQYFVNVDDRDVVRFLKLLTFVSLDEIRRFEALEGAELRDAKRLLARAITAIVHGPEVADATDAAARAAFGGAGGDQSALPTLRLDGQRLAAGPKIVDLIVELGFAPSKSAARRLIEQRGVRVGDREITAVDAPLLPSDGTTLLRVGKRHVGRLILDQ